MLFHWAAPGQSDSASPTTCSMCAPLKLQQSYDVHAACSRCRAAYSTAYSIPRHARPSHGTNDADANHRGSAGELQTRLRRGAAHRCSPASKMKRTSPMRPFVALPSPLRAFGVASASMTTGSSVLTKTAEGNDAAGASVAVPVSAHNTPKRPSADVGWASLVPVRVNGGSEPSPVAGKGGGGAQSRRVCGAGASPFSLGADAGRGEPTVPAHTWPYGTRTRAGDAERAQVRVQRAKEPATALCTGWRRSSAQRGVPCATGRPQEGPTHGE